MVARLKLKGIDGGSHKRWRMWLNSRLREEPYPGLDMRGLTPGNRGHTLWVERAQVLHGCRQLVSWDVGLSPLTSETLVASCQRVMPRTLARLPVLNRRKAGTTSSPHGLYDQGCTRPTMARTKRRKPARASKSQKTRPSSDCRLQLACMKPESLVIAGQHTAVNVFLSLVHTARQATKVGGIRSRRGNPQGS